MNYWLLKSEPGNFSLADLRARPEQREPWDGVRNFQARNFMRQMRAGDQAFFYHSNAKPSGIVGVVEIVGEARPDPTQFDPESRYFDAKATVDAPRWDLVIVQFVRAFPAILPLALLKDVPALADMEVVRKGSRLSISPVSPAEWQAVLALAEEAFDGN